ncbi:MAG TPA: hypothetical protein VJY62_15910 [Bacteroidia bacterium]|nr:hypothetical protein [Bacteroidia bacterium]
MELNLFPFPAIDILRFVCQQLDNLKIEYIITGSVAMTLYGTARQTRDIDIIVNLRMEDAESFISIFKGDYYLNPDTVKEEIKRRGTFNIISQTTRFKLDLF